MQNPCKNISEKRSNQMISQPYQPLHKRQSSPNKRKKTMQKKNNYEVAYFVDSECMGSIKTSSKAFAHYVSKKPFQFVAPQIEMKCTEVQFLIND